MKHLFNISIIGAALCAGIAIAILWQWMYWATSSSAIVVPHDVYRAHLSFFTAGLLICSLAAYLTRPRT